MPELDRVGIRKILRCHEASEICRTRAYFAASTATSKRRRTRWRRERDSNPRYRFTFVSLSLAWKVAGFFGPKLPSLGREDVRLEFTKKA